MSAPPQPTIQRGIVKQILSGDAVVIRGPPRGGPPKERTLCLSNVTAPRLARRANPNFENSQETKDEAYAWEAREYLREKILGKEVSFTVEYKVPGTGREYGCIYVGKDMTGENLTESMIIEGFLEVRRGGIKQGDEGQQLLIQLEETAKSAGKGKWNTDAANDHIRDITWTIENPRHFVDSHHGKPVDAVIEHVRDGCTVRAFLLPSFDYVTVMLSGVKCPMFKMEGDQQVPEAFADEAKFFTEVRLLQRNVQIILEGVSNQNLLGTVLHPNGNITELLLREGFARCVDWSMGVVSQGAEKLRAAEKIAKDKKLRMWKDYQSVDSTVDIKDKNFQGKVMEIVNGDAMVVKTNDGTLKKIFLASIRPPRPADGETIPDQSQKRSRPLYDIPYMFEAREFLRKKLIGKKVNVLVDYIQPPSQGFPERSCCTVTIAGINVAEALIGKGYGSVVRYRQDDDQRSSCYDLLLAGEARAQKKGVGLHSKKDAPIHRVADVAGDLNKAKQFLPFLQRAGRSEGIVEFVASGSRLRVYIPRETCLITLLVSGIECPRGARPVPGGGAMIPADAYGDEAAALTKEMCMQREVEVEVEAMDKGGNFIGWLYIDGVNMSISLVEEGLSKVHFTAERSQHYKSLCNAEEKAKEKRLNIWANYEDSPKEIEQVDEQLERKVNWKKVVVTEIKDDIHFYAQCIDQGPELVKLMEQMRADLTMSPPLPGSYTPKRGDICAAKFTEDDEWYRAKVEKVNHGQIHLFYIDYGNREISTPVRCCSLPATFHSLPGQVREYALSCIRVPEEEEQLIEVLNSFSREVLDKELMLNVEYKGVGCEHVTLLNADTNHDIAQQLLSDGVLLVENRREKRLLKLVSDYQKAQDKAMAARLNLWRYGDFREDDAKEFGYQA